MKRTVIIILIGVTVALSGYYLLSKESSSIDNLYASVTRGDFQIDVATTGELEAKNSVSIMGPSGLNRANIWQIKIDRIIDEGTVVNKGDFIAQLDQSELLDKINQANNDYQQSLSQFTQTKMDTALDLRKSRDELVNLQFDVEEKQIVVDQSLYEPEAIKRQNQIDLTKAERKQEQATENYLLQSQKAQAQMSEAAAKLQDDRQKLEFLQSLLEELVITAPEPGMLIYKRNWRGQKQGVGATIQPWDPVVATLPDLTKMVSKTYVNEVDIRIIKTGQLVDIGLDAFPDKELTGRVVEVANIGEQKPNSDSKVFQVMIEVQESDTTLRPAMTTSNKIIAEMIPSVLSVPLESVHNLGDSLSYVLLEENGKLIRQEVVLGKSNSNKVVVKEGLSEGDRILLSIPLNLETAPLISLREK